MAVHIPLSKHDPWPVTIKEGIEARGFRANLRCTPNGNPEVGFSSSRIVTENGKEITYYKSGRVFYSNGEWFVDIEEIHSHILCSNFDEIMLVIFNYLESPSMHEILALKEDDPRLRYIVETIREHGSWAEIEKTGQFKVFSARVSPPAEQLFTGKNCDLMIVFIYTVPIPEWHVYLLPHSGYEKFYDLDALIQFSLAYLDSLS